MKKLKLLYAEDEIKTRNNHIKYINTHYDFEIIEASNGDEAWQLYVKHKPDVILTDITMPKMCGLTFIEKIRENDNNTKIIVLSAHNDEDKLLKAIELNLVSYQIKPINRKKLNNSLEKVIGSISTYSSEYYFSKDIYFNKEYNILVDNYENIKLTSYEIKLLILFIKNKNKILTLETIYNNVWDDLSQFNLSNVRTLIKKLRKKLPSDTIETLYGGGYKLVI